MILLGRLSVPLTICNLYPSYYDSEGVKVNDEMSSKVDDMEGSDLPEPSTEAAKKKGISRIAKVGLVFSLLSLVGAIGVFALPYVQDAMSPKVSFVDESILGEGVNTTNIDPDGPPSFSTDSSVVPKHDYVL